LCAARPGYSKASVPRRNVPKWEEPKASGFRRVTRYEWGITSGFVLRPSQPAENFFILLSLFISLDTDSQDMSKRKTSATVTREDEAPPRPQNTVFSADELRALAEQMQTVAEGLVQTQNALAENKIETNALKRKLETAGSSTDWNHRGNQVQYDVHVRVLNNLAQACMSLEVEQYDDAKAFINAGILLVSERIKDIRIADKSPGGWGTIDEYRGNSLASDEDDAAKIRRAENAAVAKQLKRKQASADRGRGASRGVGRGRGPYIPAFSVPNQAAVYNAQLYPNNPWVSANYPQQPVYNPPQPTVQAPPRQLGPCYICSGPHLRNACPILRNQQAAQQYQVQTQNATQK
jgi:hypothetical protein